VVQRDLANQKIARARAYLADAEPILARTKEAFTADRKERDLALFYLFLALQECIDLAAHWIADDGLPPSDDYAGSFEVLAQHGRIPAELGRQMAGAAGLRNLIAHGYAAMDPLRVHEQAPAGVVAIRQFLDQVARAAGL
jgi:uncharacterized protein YutE (UPF0331/DUF86 family)